MKITHLLKAGLLGSCLVAASSVWAQTSTDLEERMQRVQERINLIGARATQVDDAHELKNLQRTFGYMFDKGLWEDVADLFTEDGGLELGKNGLYQGRESIRNYLYSLSGNELGLQYGQLNTHFQLQPVVTIAEDGQSAKGRWNTLIQTAMFDEEGQGGEWGGGVYENDYVKQDGVWQISKMRFYLEFYAPYEGGWTRGPEDRVDSYLASDIAPDQPTSDNYQSYPAFDVAPFHYDNPVTAQYQFGLSEMQREVAVNTAPPVTSDGSVDALEAQVRDISLRVQRLKAYNEIENLESAYGYYVDQSLGDAVAELFVEDGTLEILGRGVFLGLSRIITYMERLGCCGPVESDLYNHIQLQPVIHVSEDGKTAEMRARLMVMFARQGTNAQWGEGVYENTFINDEGTWKYRNLHGFQTFYTTYEDGWGRFSSPLFNYFDGFPADRPHSIEYEPYPAFFVPPFHYDNPVTGKPVQAPAQKTSSQE